MLALAALGVGLVAAPLGANPNVPHVSDWAITPNLTALGFSENAVPLDNAAPDDGVFNSDLAFWGDMAVQGTYDGFRLVDITFPSRPKTILNYEDCYPEGNRQGGNQGDITIWGDILIRSSNSPASSTTPQTCDGDPVPAGFEGLIVFDISNKLDPDVVAMVDLECGSHTQTLVPDVANGRVLIYNSSTTGVPCAGIEIVEIPLANPAGAHFLRFEPSGDPVPPFPNLITVDAPSSAAGTYIASGANWGTTAPESGIAGSIVLVNDGTALPSEGCNPLVGFPAGAIALVDRGTCPFLQKAANAQAAGAVAMIVANNAPGDPITLGGDDPGHTIAIPAGMISQADGATIKAGLPASGKFASAEMPETPERSCHDTGVILGDAMKVGCAGHDGYTVWTIDPAEGGSLEDPKILYSKMVEGVTVGHSAAFTWDGEILVFGHEPGGGSQAQCQATSAEVNRTVFFVDVDTGDIVGSFVHPRPQTDLENCTWHNYNIVPLKNKNRKPRYVLVSSAYQAGTNVVDFSDPANAKEIAYADPPPLVDPNPPVGIEVGGDWSTYWYNGRIYESDITRGLTIWRLDDPAVNTFLRTDHLNPQTAEFTIHR
ncbi:MAG: PA domain-containing protein [Gaiellaceae bacterium]